MKKKKKAWNGFTFWEDSEVGFIGLACSPCGPTGYPRIQTGVYRRARDAKRALKRLAKDFGLELRW